MRKINQYDASVIMDDDLSEPSKESYFMHHMPSEKPPVSLAQMREISEEIALSICIANRESAKEPWAQAQNVFYCEDINIPLDAIVVPRDISYLSMVDQEVNNLFYARFQHIMMCFNTDDCYVMIFFNDGNYHMKIVQRDEDYIKYMVEREKKYVT